jgi:hypothetical protein
MFPALIRVILLQRLVPLIHFVLHLHLSLPFHVFVYPVPLDQQVILEQQDILVLLVLLDQQVLEK